MYISNDKLKEIMIIKSHLTEVNRLSKIIRKHEEEEKRIIAVGNFVKKLPTYEEGKEQRNKLAVLCRMYCSYEMNLTCFSQEVLTEEKNINQKLKELKEEKIQLLKLLTKLDNLTTTPKLDANRRKLLSDAIAQKEFNEFKKEYEEVVQIVRMICTTEISIKKGNELLQMVISHLKALSKYLK